MKLKKKDLKVVSKERAYWLKVENETKGQVEILENRLKFEREVLKMVEKKLKSVK